MSKLKEKLENLKEKQVENDFIKRKQQQSQGNYSKARSLWFEVIRNFGINNSASCKYFLMKFCSIHNEKLSKLLSFILSYIWLVFGCTTVQHLGL